MARPLRIEFPGACYHVINRGNYRQKIFVGKGAAEAFVSVLAESAERFGWRVGAYVVMSNHFHLAVELTEPNLSEGMKWLQGTWAQRFNRYRGWVGRPFQGRYKALLAEPGEYYGRVVHYIHLNPVRARIVAAERADGYPWSSLVRFPARDRPAWLVPEAALESAGGLRDTPRGWKSYLDYLEFLATDPGQRKLLVAAKMSRGWCLGSAAFKQEMRLEAKKRGAALDGARYAGLEPEEVRAERHAAWEERLQQLATAGGIDLARLGPRKSDPAKVLLAAALKQGTSVSNAWLAERLQLGRPGSASQFIRRFRLQPKGNAAVTRLLSRIQT